MVITLLLILEDPSLWLGMTGLFGDKEWKEVALREPNMNNHRCNRW